MPEAGGRVECTAAPADAGLVALARCTLAGSSTRPGGLDDDLKRRIIETYYVREVKLVNGEEASARPVLRLTEEKRNIRFRDNVRPRTPPIRACLGWGAHARAADVRRPQRSTEGRVYQGRAPHH